MDDNNDDFSGIYVSTTDVQQLLDDKERIVWKWWEDIKPHYTEFDEDEAFFPSDVPPHFYFAFSFAQAIRRLRCHPTLLEGILWKVKNIKHRTASDVANDITEALVTQIRRDDVTNKTHYFRLVRAPDGIMKNEPQGSRTLGTYMESLIQEIRHALKQKFRNDPDTDDDMTNEAIMLEPIYSHYFIPPPLPPSSSYQSTTKATSRSIAAAAAASSSDVIPTTTVSSTKYCLRKNKRDVQTDSCSATTIVPDEAPSSSKRARLS
jgi:hypothetical protein